MVDGLDELTARLARLETIEAVREVKSRYWANLDRCDFAAVRACFADDAVIEMEGVPPCDGPDGYVDYCRAINPPGGTMNLHAGQNARITPVDEDHATGLWDQLFVGILPREDGQPTLMRLTGVYEDDYVRRDGRWLIAAMRFRQTSFLMGPPGAGMIVAANSGAAFG